MKILDKKVGVAVIGAGWWATYAHLPAVIKHPKAEGIAVQSRNCKKAEKIAQDFQCPWACQTIEEVLAIDGIDAVIVSSTPNMHYEQALKVLQAGKHLLLEKPMTFTAEEALELVTLAQQKNLHLLVSCPWHYTRHGKKARELITTGHLGAVKMISVLMTNPLDKLFKGINTSPTHGMDEVYVEPRKGSYNDPKIAGGGQIYCQVSHVGAYLSYLTGQMPRSVYARIDNCGYPVDLYNVLNIEMERGTMVSVASTAATPESDRNYEVRIYGTKGVIFLELWKGTMKWVPFEGEPTLYQDLSPEEIYPAEAPALNLIDLVNGVGENASSGQQGLASMQIITAAIASNEQKQPVECG